MKNLLLTLGLFIVTAMGVRANVAFSDSFAYPDGSIVDNSAGIWINNTGGGAGNQMLVTNQQLIVSTSRTEDIAARLNSTFPVSGSVTSLYSSFTVKFTGMPTLAGAYFAHFSGTNAFGTLSGFRARLWATTTNLTAGATNAAGQFSIAIANSGLSGNTNAQPWTAPFSTNVTYTVVTRYTLATGVSTFWVNPTAETDPGVTATDSIPVGDNGANGLATNGPVDITHYGFRQATGEGTMNIDNFKVSTRFNDIAGNNTSPSISGIPNQSTPANTPIGPIAFSVTDTETPGSLILSATSGNTTIVPNSNITLGSSGGSSNITITPASGQQGAAAITVSVTDGTNVTSTAFTLTVGAPSISAIANQITSVDQPITIPFTVTDAENDVLTFATNSSNPTLVPNSNISIGGSGSNRTITLTPASGLNGNSTITISAYDGYTTVQRSFVLTVKAVIGVLFSEDFTYPDGALYNNSIVWTHATSGSGTGNELQVTNGIAIVNSALTEDVMANLAGQPYAASTGVVLYCSFTLNESVLPTAGGTYFMHYRDSAAGSSFKCKVFTAKTNAATGFYRVGIANSANAIDAASQFPLDLALGTTYTVLTRYNIGTGESRLWINPNAETDTSVGASDAASASIIGAICLREEAGTTGIQNIDNLKIGTSFLDVITPVAVAPTLSVALSGGSVKISWPTNATGFNLESTPSLTAPITWSPAGSPTPVGTNNVVTISSPTGNLFYRLHQ
jgi:hypothetical protein